MSDVLSAEEYNALVTLRKPGKYRNVRTVIDGITFDSKAEARRYQELKMLEREGFIAHLHLQPKFPLFVNDEKICTYVGDFRYVNKGGETVVEDVKGVKTPAYVLKKKLMKAIHGIIITEVQ